MRVPWWLTEIDWLMTFLVMRGYTVRRHWNVCESEPDHDWRTFHRDGHRAAFVYRSRF